MPLRHNRFQKCIAHLIAPPYAAVPWAVWLYALICFFLLQKGGVFNGELVGYDDHVRMTEVLNWINGAGWYDRTITRVDPPEGFTTIWSRLTDAPIALVVLVAQQFVAQKTAALIAAVVVPFIELAIVLPAAAYFARPLAGRKEANLLVLFIMFTTVMNFRYFSVAGFHPGEASHHPWYIILALLLFGSVGRLTLIAHRPVSRLRPLMLAIGLEIALLLAVGIEGFPLVAIACGMIGLNGWLFTRPALVARMAESTAIAVCLSLVLLPLHQPPRHIFDVSFAEPSILGPIILSVVALVFAAEAAILRRIGHRKFLSFALIALVIAAAALALIFNFPSMLNGPAAALSPAERQLAGREHLEAQPIFKVAYNTGDLISLIMPCVLALISGIVTLWQAKTSRRRALALCFFGFAAFNIGMAGAISRFYHHALTTSCVWLLIAWQEIRKRLPRNAFGVSCAALAFVALGPFWMLVLPALAYNNPVLSHILLYPAKAQSVADPCQSVAFGDFLDAHYPPKTIILTPGESSSRLLYHSHLTIDFLNNYPSHDRFQDNEYFLGTQNPEVALMIAKRHRIDLVAVCPALMKVYPLHDGEQPMLYESLLLGQPPAWLKPVDTGLGGGYKLFAVDLAAADQPR